MMWNNSAFNQGESLCWLSSEDRFPAPLSIFTHEKKIQITSKTITGKRDYVKPLIRKFLCTRETNKLKALKIKGQFNVAVLHEHKRLIQNHLLLLQVDHRTLTVSSMSAVASYYHHLIPALGIHGWLFLSSELDYRLSMLALIVYLREAKHKAAIRLGRKHSTHPNMWGLFFTCDVVLCAPQPIWNTKFPARLQWY